MQPKWMDHAWERFGVREHPGRRFNPVIEAAFDAVGHGYVRDDAVPWCAAFVGGCLEEAGQTSTRSLRARSYLKWGQETETARYGAVAVLSRGNNPAAGHVGFVVGELDDRLFLLGGNQSDAVTVAPFPRSRVLSLRLPDVVETDRPKPATDGGEAQTRTAQRFLYCLKHVLRMEGGYSNDPHDPGGPTNKGITLSTFAAHLGRDVTDATRSDLIARLKDIPSDVVSDIYDTRYWQPSRASEMPGGVDLMHFDAAVNHGVTGAARLLQQATGVNVDGEIGPITMAGVRRAKPQDLIRAYADERTRRYRALPHFWRFGRGWLNRVKATRAASLSLAAASTQSQQKEGQDDMSQIPNSSHMPTKWWGQSMTIWGALMTTLTTVLPVVAPVFGLNVSAGLIEQIGQHAVTIVQALGGIAGIVMTIVGRARATTRLTT